MHKVDKYTKQKTNTVTKQKTGKKNHVQKTTAQNISDVDCFENKECHTQMAM